MAWKKSEIKHFLRLKVKWRVKQEIIPEASCLYIQLASACALSLRVVTGAEERQRERKSEE